MALEVRMPELGQTSDEVRLVYWLVGEGDEVRRGDPLCEVETEKSVMDLESVGTGVVLRLLVAEDTEVVTGTVIALLGERGEELPEAASQTAIGAAMGPRSDQGQADDAGSSSIGAAVPPSPRSTTEAEGSHEADVRATKIVRHLATKSGVDLRQIRGSGPGGLITRDDLQAILDGGQATLRAETDVAEREAAQQPGIGAAALSAHQQAVARSLSHSKTEIPHYYLTMRVAADALLAWRESHPHSDGQQVSFYSLFGYATARALHHHPRLNAVYVDRKLQLRGSVNVGVAVAAEDELYVPVIHGADALDIHRLDQEIRRMVRAARRGALEPGAESGGTITLTNLGMFPIGEFYPIINPPQTAILGFGHIGKELHVQDDGRMRVRSALTVTGSFDHRVVNGAQAAAFLAEVKRVMEEELEA